MGEFEPNALPTLHSLQMELTDEIEDVLKDIVTKNAAGKRVKGIKGYRQRLPKEENENEEEEDKQFPYFIVRIMDGETKNAADSWKVNVIVIIGIHDDSNESTGHDHLLACIQRLMNHFALDGSSGKKGGRPRCDEDISFLLNDEEIDTWPYFFGAMSLTFNLYKPRRPEPRWEY